MSNGLRSKTRLRRLLDEDYDMNEKISNNDKEMFSLIWRAFVSIPRSSELSNRSCGNTRNIREIRSTFFQTIDYITVL